MTCLRVFCPVHRLACLASAWYRWTLATLTASALCLQLHAVVLNPTITYTNGQNRSTVTTGTSPTITTLTIASGSATQSGVISGTGTFTKTGAGTLNFTATNTYTGTTNVSAGKLVFAGSSSGNIGAIQVGTTSSSTGTLDITAGSYTQSAAFYVGYTSGATGIVNQSGGTVSLGGAELLVGQGGTGTYNLSAGTLSTAANSTYGVTIGVNTNSTATFNLSGTGILNAANAVLSVGRPGYPAKNTTDAFNQTGGVATAGTLMIGGYAQAASNVSATVRLTGGTFSATTFTFLAAGEGDTANVTIGGTAQVTLPAFPTTRGNATTTTLTFDTTAAGGGFLAPGASSTTFMPTGTFTHAYLTANGARLNTNGYDITIGQVLEDQTSDGTLTKTGAGTLTLSGANTYNGATTVSAGTLLINGSTASGSTVTVSSGGTLGGSGTIGGATTIQSGGSLAPGNSPGLLTFGGALTLNSGSTSTFQVDSTTRGTGYDAIDVSGLTTYGGTLSLVFGTTLASGTTLDLFGLTGGFASDFSAITASGLYSGSFTDNGDTWTLTTDGQTFTFSDSTGDLSVAAASAVPEPSTYAAFAGFAALVIAALRRRRVG